jgi:LysM repeat protein
MKIIHLSILLLIAAILSACQTPSTALSSDDPYASNYPSDGNYQPYNNSNGPQTNPYSFHNSQNAPAGAFPNQQVPTESVAIAPAESVNSNNYAYTPPPTSSSKPKVYSSSSSSSKKTTTSKSKSSSSSSSKSKTYTVQKGDTLYGIANKKKTSVAKIKSANALKTDMIKPGQTLKIP